MSFAMLAVVLGGEIISLPLVCWLSPTFARDAAHTSGPTESVAPVILRACACDAAAGGDNMAMPLKSHLNVI